MSRYVSRPVSMRPRADDGWWDQPLIQDIHVDGGKEVHTGLIDSFGNDIIRVRPPIGFGRDGEW